jgi:hypothetical protein
MVPIRSAAYMALIPLAPKASAALPNSDTVGNALVAPSSLQLEYSLKYTKAAASVTMHDTRDGLELAADPVNPHSPVTARVTYAYHCTVPVVRALMCMSIKRLGEGNVLMRRASQMLPNIVDEQARFKVLSATATLPNQGADYEPREEP